MKKLIILILAIALLPVFAFAKLEVETEVYDCDHHYNYDWIMFFARNEKHSNNKGNWKYGYIAEKKDNGTYLYIPKQPTKYKLPDYLANYPIVNKNVYVYDFKNRFTEKNAVRLVRINNWKDWEDGITFGVTEDNSWFVVNNGGYQSYDLYPTHPKHNKFLPYKDAKSSVMKTIMMHCEYEQRKPTISEQYILLYLDVYGDKLCNRLNAEYQQEHAKEYQAAKKAVDYEMYLIGPIRLIGWCLLILFLFALPGIVLVILKFVFPKGSIIYNAVCILEVMLGIFAISYWYGSRR